MPNNNTTITSCLCGALIFLGLYLLFTSWCSQRDYYISPTTSVLSDAYYANYDETTPEDEYDPENFEGRTIQDEAEKDAIDYYFTFPSEPGRLEKTRQFQEVMTNKYNKELRYC